MSIAAFKWAKTWRGELSSPQMFVLLMVADYYNEKARRAWPAIGTLAADTCLSVSTVKRTIKSLAELGLVEVEIWHDNNGRQMQNRYCLPLYDSSSIAFVNPVVAEWDMETGMPVGVPEDGDLVTL